MADWVDAPRTFVRVYRLPEKLTDGFCFGGGREIAFLNVDWFDMALIGNARAELEAFVRGKPYYDRAARFLVLADDPSLVFTIEPAETQRHA